VLGVSFDPPDVNRAFTEKHGFPFRLLSDVDRTAGEIYQTKRAPEESFPENAKRRTYVIDPGGTIVKAYRVTDIAGHPDQVLKDLRRLMTREP